MNGSTGIQPTIELATTNGTYPYPVCYGNNNGFFGSDGLWAILLLALLFNGNNGFGFGGNGNNDFAWLSNGQKDIMTNTNNGFDTLHLSNQLEGNRDAINGISNAICSGFADTNQAITNGFFNAEISAGNRNLNTLQALNGLNTSLLNCCCENRLASANLNSTIISENCADRQLINEIGRDIITNQTANTQKILDQLCQDKIDSKNEKIVDLQREILMKDLQASQIAQTAQIRAGQVQEIDAMYQRLKDCPVGTTPVYGNQPIFTCPNNNGCGCGNGFYNI